MSRLKVITAALVMGAAIAAPASACSQLNRLDATKADLVIIGEAIDIKTIYLEPKDTGWKERRAASSRLTFKVMKVIRGEYDGDTIDATYDFYRGRERPEDLDPFRAGADNQAVIGMRLIDEPEAQKSWEIIGGDCSSDYFMLKPKPSTDGDWMGEGMWHNMLKL